MNKNDIVDLSKILKDPEVMYAWEHTFSEKEIENWYNNQIERYNKNGYGYWAVILNKANEFIGQCGLLLENINGEELLGIGYLFNKNYWHKGYATEAALGCIKYAFEKLKENKIYVTIRINNILSQKVAEQIRGFIRMCEPY
jgi:RimJ/RimL family protein N-acetyltransferase